jgi:SAM-dependent methyltransferase
MLNYTIAPSSIIKSKHGEIKSFIDKNEKQNIDWETVNSFGEEWSKFNFFPDEEITDIGSEYFDIISKNVLNKNSYVLDVGCGTGRWTRYVADQVGFVEAVDPSNAVLQADVLLADKNNVRISQASADYIPFPDNSFDLVFSLGVLHHIPDTKKALSKCVEKVKPGGYFLVYLYYSLDNRGFLFKALFSLSNIFRQIICRLPHKLKNIVCDVIAVCIYMPFIFIAKAFDKIPLLKKVTGRIPLSYYRTKSFKVIRNDALDRFGTPLEQRFSKNEIHDMMQAAGLTEIVFSSKEPYWHAVGKKI